MSSTAHFFIEKQDKDGKWNLIQALYPFTKRTYTVYENKEWVEKESKPDVVDTEGKEYSIFDTMSRQGSIRDIFSNTYLDEYNIADRGLPNDLSDGVKAYFDKKLARVEKENQEYREATGKERPYSGKWWWGESYFTLKELRDIIDEEEENFKRLLEEKFRQKYETSAILNKCDEILSILKKEEKKTVKNEEDNDIDESIEYYMNDKFWEIINLNSFADQIGFLADELSDEYCWLESDKVRIIVYCS